MTTGRPVSRWVGLLHHAWLHRGAPGRCVVVWRRVPGRKRRIRGVVEQLDGVRDDGDRGFESGTGDGDGGVDRTLTPAVGGEADEGSVCADGSISERREPWAAGVAELAKGVVQDGPRSGAGGKASGPLHGSESPGHRCVGPLSTTTSPRASFAFAPVTFRSTVVAGPLTQVEALKLVPGAGAMNAESLPGSVVTAVPRWRRSDTPSGTTGPARRRRSACAYSGRSNWMGPDSSIRIVAVAPEASCTVSGRLAATSNAATPTPTLTVSGSGKVQ